jgi:hypothetical protein
MTTMQQAQERALRMARQNGQAVFVRRLRTGEHVIRFDSKGALGVARPDGTWGNRAELRSVGLLG